MLGTEELLRSPDSGKRQRMRVRTMIITTGLACGLSLVGASPAMAANGKAWSTDAGAAGASTYYDDGPDSYLVCDEDGDYMGAAGWIEVRQADGSWSRFAKKYAGGGVGDCTGNNVDVTRENAQVKIVACRQNGPDATPQDCGYIIVQGG